MTEVEVLLREAVEANAALVERLREHALELAMMAIDEPDDLRRRTIRWAAGQIGYVAEREVAEQPWLRPAKWLLKGGQPAA